MRARQFENGVRTADADGELTPGLRQHGVHDRGAGVGLWDAQHRRGFKTVFQGGFVLLVFKGGVGNLRASAEITDFFLPDRR